MTSQDSMSTEVASAWADVHAPDRVSFNTVLAANKDWRRAVSLAAATPDADAATCTAALGATTWEAGGAGCL